MTHQIAIKEMEATAERVEEMLALVNMLTYVEEVAASVGARTAAGYVKSAKAQLASHVAGAFSNEMSEEQISLAAISRAGNC